MFSRFKEAVNNVMSGSHVDIGYDRDDLRQNKKKLKYPYARPDFLKLNPDEVQVSADHSSRPILVPRDISRIPWGSGYAEVINSGKSRHNEDQACAGLFFVHRPAEVEESPLDHMPTINLAYYKEKLKHLDIPFDIEVLEKDPLPFTYFSIFDGHAGTGAALMAVNMLHNILKEKLSEVRDLLLIKRYGLDDLEAGVDPSTAAQSSIFRSGDPVTVDSLVTGALESAFFQMDDIIGKEKQGFRVSGGCTALVALFFMGKLYVANAGDCRAIVAKGKTVTLMSHDFTPVSERQRLQLLGEQQPELIQPVFTHLDFIRKVLKRDLGKQVLCRNGRMKGWAYKTVTEEDLKFPLVYGDGKRARLLATIGVTRGFGDHDLKVYDTDVYIKPFLTAMPEVRIMDICKEEEHSEDDVLIMGSDGLWDVLSNAQAADIVHTCLREFAPDDPARYTSSAQELVLSARGLLKKGWQTIDSKPGSGDDITAFVIPLCRYGSGPSQTSSTESALASKTTTNSQLEKVEEIREDTLQALNDGKNNREGEKEEEKVEEITDETLQALNYTKTNKKEDEKVEEISTEIDSRLEALNDALKEDSEDEDEYEYEDERA